MYPKNKDTLVSNKPRCSDHLLKSSWSAQLDYCGSHWCRGISCPCNTCQHNVLSQMPAHCFLTIPPDVVTGNGHVECSNQTHMASLPKQQQDRHRLSDRTEFLMQVPLIRRNVQPEASELRCSICRHIWSEHMTWMYSTKQQPSTQCSRQNTMLPECMQLPLRGTWPIKTPTCYTSTSPPAAEYEVVGHAGQETAGAAAPALGKGICPCKPSQGMRSELCATAEIKRCNVGSHAFERKQTSMS